MSARTLMIQGTTSDAGKSIMVAGLCRVLARRGISVAPFKPQNMALNSAVTIDNGEIGRAQAVQAQAAGLQAHTDMNPVLLKPNSDTGAQIIIHGKAMTEMDAAHYHQYKPVAMKAVLESYDRLKQQYDVILVEGAGSPAEINLRDKDIANMGFAEAVDCPVLLIADIDRGGVFAHIVGTLELLSESERGRIKGSIINRFRGDITLLESGLDWLQEHTQKPVVGVLPYLQGLHIEAEDGLPENITDSTNNKLKIIVPALPRISNHTDFDPLRLHPQIDLIFIGPDQSIPEADVIILPGSKSVRADLQWLTTQGWPQHIQRHLRYGGKLMGICGGFQMLGLTIHDPGGIEGKVGSSEGLGYFDMNTTLAPEKQLRNVSGSLSWNKAKVSGYEIHAGTTTGAALKNPCIITESHQDGAISADGQILGSYFHGLFEAETAFSSLMHWSGLKTVEPADYQQHREQAFERLANAIEQHLDMALINDLLKLDN